MIGMGRSNIGYCGIGADGRPVTDYRAWNPCGFGCSRRCGDCWALAMSHRFGTGSCDDCRQFRLHYHPERLDQPARHKRPSVILVNFTCDTFDPWRPLPQIIEMMAAAAAAPQHTYVWLTHDASRMAAYLMACPDIPDNHYWGITVRRQGEMLSMDWLARVRAKLWLSIEPIEGDIDLMTPVEAAIAPNMRCDAGRLAGVIVGHSNRRGAPGTETLEHADSIARQCECLGVPVFVKQLWIGGTLSHAPDRLGVPAPRNLPWSAPRERKR
uniref:DUF5131 family protein n=1 Tax=viral metagenome TaxID=1070528 RepID=A0A6M3KCH1_9ZZZZ